MKKFLVILEYEIMTYLKNKSYMVSTIILAALAVIAMFIPTIFNITDLSGDDSDSDTQNQEEILDEDKDLMLLYDKNGVFTDTALLENIFAQTRWEKTDSEEALKEKIRNEDAEAGFIVTSLTQYEYCVFNKDMMDTNRSIFEQALTVANQMDYCARNGLDYSQLSVAFSPSFTSEMTVLGKDMANNYWYCYGLVIVIFMIIIMYGVMVATSVTQEKSNRTIEVLVTSADTNSLFFGKVIAGTLAALFQVGIIILALLGSYQLNRKSWGGLLDMVFDIPAEVLTTFAFFGLGGVLFYTFVYGAMGALVSKTEDINKSAGGVQAVIMVVYFMVLFNLMNVDGMLIKVLSFLPVSSYSAMFARVAMGDVQFWEVAVSFAILVISILGVGFVGAKIYRMGTLRYGNPIKISTALKSLKNKD